MWLIYENNIDVANLQLLQQDLKHERYRKSLEHTTWVKSKIARAVMYGTDPQSSAH